MSETTQEIIQAAIQFEEDGKSFYMETARKSSNPLVREMFESLARDEEKHIQWLNAESAETVNLTELGQSLYGKLKRIFSDAAEEVKDTAASASTDMEAARTALEMERKSYEAYKSWGEQGQSQEIQDLCGRLADFESFHYKLLQNALEYMQDPASWFTSDEAWIFDGGTATT